MPHLLLWTLVAGCASDDTTDAATATATGDEPATPSSPDVGDPELARILLQVSYEPDATPYTGPGPLGGDTWDLFRTNVDALFEGTGVTVEAPTSLDGMQALPDLDDQDFTVQELLDLDAQYRLDGGGGDTRVIHAIWLDGYLFDGGERQTGVIGVSIGDTGVVAMFKPVIERLGITEAVRRFGEQTTLIHEVGHAVGLVDNGVAMVEDHLDEGNGAHCDDDTCVMFWANEGVNDVAEFVTQFVVDGDSVLFDDRCRADVQAAFAR